MPSFQDRIAAKAVDIKQEIEEAKEICENFITCFEQSLKEKPHGQDGCRSKAHRKAYHIMNSVFKYLHIVNITRLFPKDEGGAPRFHCYLPVWDLGFEFDPNFDPNEMEALRRYMDKPVEQWKEYLYLCLSKVITAFPEWYANYLWICEGALFFSTTMRWAPPQSQQHQSCPAEWAILYKFFERLFPKDPMSLFRSFSVDLV